MWLNLRNPVSPYKKGGLKVALNGFFDYFSVRYVRVSEENT